MGPRPHPLTGAYAWSPPSQQGAHPSALTQIITLQALHYLTLSLVLPALLSILSDHDLLEYEGGATSISMAMNWRSFSGATASGIGASRALPAGLASLASAQAGVGAAGGMDKAELARGVVRVVARDSFRGWAVALGWVAASMAECASSLPVSRSLD